MLGVFTRLGYPRMSKMIARAFSSRGSAVLKSASVMRPRSTYIVPGVRSAILSGRPSVERRNGSAQQTHVALGAVARAPASLYNASWIAGEQHAERASAHPLRRRARDARARFGEQTVGPAAVHRQELVAAVHTSRGRRVADGRDEHASLGPAELDIGRGGHVHLAADAAVPVVKRGNEPLERGLECHDIAIGRRGPERGGERVRPVRMDDVEVRIKVLEQRPGERDVGESRRAIVGREPFIHRGRMRCLLELGHDGIGRIQRERNADRDAAVERDDKRTRRIRNMWPRHNRRAVQRGTHRDLPSDIADRNDDALAVIDVLRGGTCRHGAASRHTHAFVSPEYDVCRVRRLGHCCPHRGAGSHERDASARWERRRCGVPTRDCRASARFRRREYRAPRMHPS